MFCLLLLQLLLETGLVVLILFFLFYYRYLVFLVSVSIRRTVLLSKQKFVVITRNSPIVWFRCFGGNKGKWF